MSGHAGRRAGRHEGGGATRVDIRGKAFGATPVLGPIAFAIAPGERVALVGPSGIGKTTLLRILTGLERDFAGHVERPSPVAMVFQEPVLLPWRSALANISLATGAGEETARAALVEVGLADKTALYPGQLSLGQQRRLALARAFCVAPALLVMDEPFVSLDEALADEMMDLALALIERHATTVLLVTHSAREAQRLATRVLRLEGVPARLAAH